MKKKKKNISFKKFDEKIKELEEEIKEQIKNIKGIILLILLSLIILLIVNKWNFSNLSIEFILAIIITTVIISICLFNIKDKKNYIKLIKKEKEEIISKEGEKKEGK